MRNRGSLTQLGETEMEILHHVWTLGTASVADVHARVLAERPVAYTTIMTVTKRLADKGYLRYERAGRTYVYAPAQPPGRVRYNLLKRLMERAFGDSPVALVKTLVCHANLSAAERREIAEMIKAVE